MKVQYILLSGFFWFFITGCFYTSKVPLSNPEKSVIDSTLIGFWRVYYDESFEAEEEGFEIDDEEIYQFISILPFNENYYIVDMLSYEDSTTNLLHFFNQTNYWQKSHELNYYNSRGDIIEIISQDWIDEIKAWENGRHIINNYDSRGNVTESISQYWDNEKKTWINSSNIINNYDSAGNKISHLQQRWNNKLKEWFNKNRELESFYGTKIKEKSTQDWNSITNSWINKNHWLYYFDNDSNMTEYISQTGDKATNEWRNSIRGLYSTDNKGNTIEKVKFRWDTITNDWISNSRSINSYDSLRNDIGYTSYKWDTISNDWISDSRSTNSYDSLGNKMLYTSYKWDTITNDWIDNSRKTNSYDSFGNDIGYTSYKWNKEKSDWGKTSRKILVYDSDNNKIEDENQVFNQSTGNWSDKKRTIFKYDKQGNQTEERSQKWNPEIKQWEDYKNNPKHHSTFNDSGQKTEFIKGAKTKENYFYDKNGNLLKKILNEWSIDEKEWIKSNQENYFYDLLGNLTEVTEERRVYSSYPGLTKLKVFCTAINNIDYFNVNFILDLDRVWDIEDPNEYIFFKTERISQDIIKVLLLVADFDVEFNNSQEFRDYVNSNFDLFNERFEPLYILKKLKLDSHIPLY